MINKNNVSINKLILDIFLTLYILRNGRIFNKLKLMKLIILLIWKNLIRTAYLIIYCIFFFNRN